MLSASPRPRRLVLAFLLPALLPGLSACGEGEGPYVIEEVRERDADQPPTPAGMSDAERLGLVRGDPHAGMAGDPHGGMGGDPSAAARSLFAWDAPEDWEPIAPTMGQIAAFRLGGHEDAVASLSLLSGRGGGVLANVNRWRGQLGLDPVTDEAVAALPRRGLLGRDAVFVDVEGAYKGMGPEVRIESARLIGAILTLPQATVFVKLIGPVEIVEGERSRFEAFLDSITFGRRPDAARGTPVPADPETAPITWDAPEGWVEQPGSPSRAVTFRPAGSAETECSLTVLPGSAGGVAANINRWRSQMGQEPMTEVEFTALPRLTLDGTSAVLTVVRGHYRGMGEANTPEAMLLGLVWPRDEDTVFVKMTGPATEVEQEEANFRAFCNSLGG